MSEEEIKKNNCLIADFMGLHHRPDGYLLPKSNPLTRGRDYGEWATTETCFEKGVGRYECWLLNIEHLAYHYSWDWLMSAVEVIEIESGFRVSIKGGECIVRSGYIFVSKQKIESVYLAVVDFIKNTFKNGNYEYE